MADRGRYYCSGVLINDITDHFPVYTQCEYEITRSNPQSYRYSRSLKSENRNSFVTDLYSETWQNVTNADNFNVAYDTFLNVFLKKYDKHCPIVKINTKHVNSKKKNVVYKWLEKCLSQKEQFIEPISEEEKDLILQNNPTKCTTMD